MGEASDEVEVLKSIFPDEFTLDSEDPWKFTICLYPSENKDDSHVGINLVCVLPANYPESIPEVEIEGLKGLGKKQIDELKKIANRIADENIGMPSVFMICEGMKEWLNDNNIAGQDGSMYAEMMRRMQQKEVEVKKKTEKALISAAADNEASASNVQLDPEEEERQRRRQAGVAVTVDSFLQWKAKFDAEIRALEQTKAKDERENKPTGKQLFMMNKAGLEEGVLSASELEEMEKALEAVNELDLENFDFEGFELGEDDEDGDYEDGDYEYASGDEDEDIDDEDNCA